MRNNENLYCRTELVGTTLDALSIFQEDRYNQHRVHKLVLP